LVATVMRERSPLQEDRALATSRSLCPISLSSAPADLDLLKRCRDLGIVRVNVALAAANTAEALPILDQWAALRARI